MAKLGLIAGNGNLPVLFAQAATAQGIDLVTITVTPEAASDELNKIVDQSYQISVGQLKEIITTLQDEEVEEVVMLGKVTKELLFQGIELDQEFKMLLAQLEEKNDDAIMLAIVDRLAEAGIKVSDQTKFIEELFPQPGVLTDIEPESQILDDMKLGFKQAKEIGRLDIGQTVVVKDGAVMAVEAIEGTDQAILRGGKLGQGEVVVAKVSKPKQDQRFDIPTVGLETLENLIKVDAAGLVIEAGETFIVNQEEFIKRAEENEIPIVAIKNIKTS
ncbi:UDP-2,3-diacylglucosamine diphosphatase LpxI [Natroniella sulfidigena]|uniref:LpxI family protein n=1 Tax=Natroniella sulfidigena TaxID=723921 RepID=UPI00200B9D6C|nr:UDP-2,3-diacylglucosamine diphosphatase LpxI [Natroniella sulfidigena]MCK8816356.1 UDP-2,3-diacylglucosamine diphosphatase LpxI [Natroniella sulfidigena]